MALSNSQGCHSERLRIALIAFSRPGEVAGAADALLPFKSPARGPAQKAFRREKFPGHPYIALLLEKVVHPSCSPFGEGSWPGCTQQNYLDRFRTLAFFFFAARARAKIFAITLRSDFDSLILKLYRKNVCSQSRDSRRAAFSRRKWRLSDDLGCAISLRFSQSRSDVVVILRRVALPQLG